MIQAFVEMLLVGAVQKYLVENKTYGKMVHLIVVPEERMVYRAAVALALGLARRQGMFGPRSGW